MYFTVCSRLTFSFLTFSFLFFFACSQEAIEVNKGLSTPKPVLEAMARSISPDIYKSFTARYTKDIALEVRESGRIFKICN